MKKLERLTCHSPIKISRILNPAPGLKKKWERFELDAVTPYQYLIHRKKENKNSSNQD